MKNTKMVLLMVVPALVVLFLGGSMRPPAAQADPIKVLTITNVMCLTMNGYADWNEDGVVNSLDNGAGVDDCWTNGGLAKEGHFRELTKAVKKLPSQTPFDLDVFNSETSDPQPEDFVKTDVDLGQLHQYDQVMYVVAFVSNDDSVGFYTDAGTFNNQSDGSNSHKSNLICGSPAMVTAGQADFTDPDCDGDSSTHGDGVVVAGFQANGADRGDYEVIVRQDHVEIKEPFKVVGEPDHITLKVMDPAIQTGAPACELFSDTPSFLAIDGEPETSPVVATVTDDDGTPITGAIVVWTVEDTDNPGHASDRARFVIPYHLDFSLSPSLDLQALGVGAPEVLCGGDEAGTVKLTARLTDGASLQELGAALDPGGKDGRSARLEYPVQGPPEKIELSASPASLVCDGTANSTVSATLTDADGKPVVNGNKVNFDVQALGVANPVDGRSATGVATSVITPLAGLTNGVVVHATWMQHVAVSLPGTPKAGLPLGLAKLKFVASDIEQTMLVNCQEAAPAAPEAPPAVLPGGAAAGSAAAGAVIGAPNTGEGGSHAPSAWLALPLGGVALLLMGSGFALRRRLR